MCAITRISDRMYGYEGDKEAANRGPTLNSPPPAPYIRKKTIYTSNEIPFLRLPTSEIMKIIRKVH